MPWWEVGETVWIWNLNQLCCLTTVAASSTIEMSWLLWFFEVIVSLFASLRLSKFDKLGPHSKRRQSVSFCNLLPHPGKAHWYPSQRKAAVCATSPVPWQVFPFSFPSQICTGDRSPKHKIFFFSFYFPVKSWVNEKKQKQNNSYQVFSSTKLFAHTSK